MPEELKVALAKRDLNPIEIEEAADLLGNRYFRASILCRADASPVSSTKGELMEEVYFATSLSAESDPFNLMEGIVERFFNRAGLEITLDASITKAAVVILAAQWPKGMRLKVLYLQAAEYLSTHGIEMPISARSQLLEELMTLFEAGQIDIRLRESEYHSKRTDYPRAHALAHFEAEHREALTTPYHLPLPFGIQEMALVRAMDGSRSMKELCQISGEMLMDEMLRVLSRWGLLEF